MLPFQTQFPCFGPICEAQPKQSLGHKEWEKETPQPVANVSPHLLTAAKKAKHGQSVTTIQFSMEGDK